MTSDAGDKVTVAEAPRALDGPPPAEPSSARGARPSMTAQAGLIVAAKMLAFAVNIALPLILVRRLSQYDFGVYKQVFLVVGTALNILPLGFQMSAYYFLPRDRDRRGQIVLNVLLFHLLAAGLACATLVFYPDLLTMLFSAPEIVQRSTWVGVLILLWVSSNFLETVVLANDEVALGSTLLVCIQWSRTLLMVVAALAFGSVDALIVAAAIQGAVQFAVLLVYLRSRFGRFWSGFDWSVARLQLAYALPLGIASVLQHVQVILPHYVVSSRFSVSEYAIYAVGCFNLPLFGILSGSVGSVVIPRVSYLQGVGDRTGIVGLMAEMTRKMSLLVFPAYAFLVVIAYDFVRLLFTDTYLPSAPIYVIFLTLVPLIIVDNVCDPVARAYAKHRFYFLRARVAVVAGLAATLWASGSRLDLVQTIAVVVAFGVLERILILAKVVGILELGRRDLARFLPLGKIALATGLAGVAAALARTAVREQPLVAIILCGLVFGAVYLLSLLVLRVPKPEEWAAVMRAVARLRRAPVSPAEDPAL